MNRRKILTAIGLSPVAALPAVAAPMTPEERIEAARTEFLEALGGVFGVDQDGVGDGYYYCGRMLTQWRRSHLTLTARTGQ